MDVVIDSELSKLVIYAITSILIIVIIVSGIAVSTAIKADPTSASESLKEFFNGGNALKILTVFAVLIAAVFLALAGQLTEGAIAILSSISGYVLGTIRDRNKESSKSNV